MKTIECDCGWIGSIDRCQPHHEIGYPLCPSCVTTYGGFLGQGVLQFRLIEEWARLKRRQAPPAKAPEFSGQGVA